MSEVIIDVREKDEFLAEHVEHAINVPLSAFNTMAPGVLNQVKDRRLVFMCRTGIRANQALHLAKGLGYDDVHSYRVFDGGLLEWKKQGGEVKKGMKSPFNLMQQTQMTIGLMTFVFALLAILVNPNFSYLVLFVGAGLFYAGLTGTCAVATLIGMAPWNKPKVNNAELNESTAS